MTLVFAGEAFNKITLVLKDAVTKSCSDAGIQRATGTAAHHVDVCNFVNKHKVPQGYSRAELPIRTKSGCERVPENARSLRPSGWRL
jgi:hypothetical protein